MGDPAQLALTEGYHSKVASELVGICDTVARLLNETIIPGNGDDAEAMTFYCKMLGDYYRYNAEFAPDEKKQDIIPLANGAYGTGTEWAQHLPPTHAVRLGLALNFSVFQHEVCRDTSTAVATALQAYDSAYKIVRPDEEEATVTLQLLQDNLMLWQPQ